MRSGIGEDFDLDTRDVSISTEQVDAVDEWKIHYIATH
jgi:hypothetical protein